MIRTLVWRLLPRTIQVALDYKGTKAEILKVFLKDDQSFTVPEIVEHSRLGITEPGPVYPHARRMVEEGLLSCREVEAHDRTRFYYQITPQGRQEADRLAPRI